MIVTINKLDDYGRGISYINDKIVFIPNTLIDEEVEIEITNETKKFYEAKVINYIKKSDKRIETNCPYYAECGGCNLMHMSYNDSIEYKKNKINEVLKKFANIKINIEVVPSENQFNYRNKISLKVINKEIGFYKSNTHDLIKIKKCRLAKDSINEVLPLLTKLNVIDGDITIRSNYNDEILIIIESQNKISFNKNDFNGIKLVGIILNNKTIYGEDFFIEKVDEFYFKISYNSFFQINNNILNKVNNLLNKNIDSSNNILDLYCGVGVLSTLVSKKVNSIYGVEIVENAIKNALINSKMNKLTNTNYMLGNTSSIINKINIEFDTIIVDPPRSGLDKNSIKYINNSNCKKIIYMSCDPVTLSRDIKELINYKVSILYLLDMFPYTRHVECVCVLYREYSSESVYKSKV